MRARAFSVRVLPAAWVQLGELAAASERSKREVVEDLVRRAAVRRRGKAAR